MDPILVNLFCQEYEHKYVSFTFVDNWLYRMGTSVMVVCYCEIIFSMYLEVREVACSVCWQFLKVDKQLSIPLIDCRVQPVCSVPMISDSKKMFVSDRKVLQVIRSSCLQGLVQRQSSSRVIHRVDHGTCLVFFNVSTMIGKSKKQASINGEMFHIYCSSGWKFLNFLKKVESNRAIFHKKKKCWKSLLSNNYYKKQLE